MSFKKALMGLNGIWAIEETSARNIHNAYLTNNLPDEPKAEDLIPDILLGPTDIDTNSDDDETPGADAEEMQVAIISLRGPISQYWYGGADYFASRIQQYAADNTVCAIILDLNTPGGEVFGTRTWLKAVQDADAIKPVLGFCEDGKVKSAGAWGWSGCRERYAGHDLCEFGSIGIMATLVDDSKAMEKMGYQELVIYAPQSTDKNKVGADALNGKTGPYKARLKIICDGMISDIAGNQDGELTSDEWQSGADYFASDALRIGLISGIKTREEVIARAVELASQNQNPNKMFRKFTALSALAGVAATSVTADQVQAVNEQIEKEKIEGVTLVLDAELKALDDSATTITGLETTISANTTKISDLESKITAKDNEIVQLKAKIAGKPAEAALDGAVVNDPPPAAAPADDKIDAKSIETETDRELARMRASYQTI